MAVLKVIEAIETEAGADTGVGVGVGAGVAVAAVGEPLQRTVTIAATRTMAKRE
ncbi:MAG TPA: hypothetical protein VHZ73_08235 [Vicinamibacterales bacterium]|nr:hypothetical protein [Vicinamibacterales bacterium]